MATIPPLSDKIKLKVIKMLFPLHKENLTAYLSPILGQYMIKNSEFLAQFLSDFHKATNSIFIDSLTPQKVELGGSLYVDQLFIPARVTVYRAGKFKIVISFPELGFLFSGFFIKRRAIYKRVVRGQLELLRNYKKLFQITIFKSFGTLEAGLKAEIAKKKYAQVRSALFQTS